MQKGYLNYLNDKYKDEFYSSISTEKIIDLEMSLWKDKNSDYRLSYLIKDEFFTKLSYLSQVGLKYAMKRLSAEKLNALYEPEITEEYAQNNIHLMEQYYENVKPFNKIIAQTYLSEGSVDYIYAAGLTDNKSLRVGRM